MQKFQVLAAVVAVVAVCNAFPQKRNFPCAFERIGFEDKYRLSYCVKNNDLFVLMQAETSGWVAVGFGQEDDSLDVVVGSIDATGKLEIDDFYATTDQLVRDIDRLNGSYDLVSTGGWEEDGWTSILFARPLSTQDPNDLEMTTTELSAMHVTLAYGKTDLESFVDVSKVQIILNAYSSLEKYEEATEYRTINASGNNIANPTWGTPFDDYIWKNGNERLVISVMCCLEETM